MDFMNNHHQSSESSPFFKVPQIESLPPKNVPSVSTQKNDMNFFMSNVDFSNKNLLDSSDDGFGALNLFKN